MLSAIQDRKVRVKCQELYSTERLIVCYISTAFFLLFFTLCTVKMQGLGLWWDIFFNVYNQLRFLMTYNKRCTCLQLELLQVILIQVIRCMNWKFSLQGGTLFTSTCGRMWCHSGDGMFRKQFFQRDSMNCLGPVSWDSLFL